MLVFIRYVHGLAFSVIDVLLLANTKAAFETLHQRLVTHINFLRADSNLQVLLSCYSVRCYSVK